MQASSNHSCKTSSGISTSAMLAQPLAEMLGHGASSTTDISEPQLSLLDTHDFIPSANSGSSSSQVSNGFSADVESSSWETGDWCSDLFKNSSDSWSFDCSFANNAKDFSFLDLPADIFASTSANTLDTPEPFNDSLLDLGVASLSDEFPMFATSLSVTSFDCTTSDDERRARSSGESATSSLQSENPAYRMQEYLIPELTVFGRRLGQEEDSIVNDSLKVSEMMAYPDTTPLITLGRAKKKTQSLSQMSNEQVDEALSSSGEAPSEHYFQAQAIKEWSGACSGDPLLEATFALPSFTPSESSPPSTCDPLNNLVTDLNAPLYAWNAKNELQLTVDISLTPSKLAPQAATNALPSASFIIHQDVWGTQSIPMSNQPSLESIPLCNQPSLESIPLCNQPSLDSNFESFLDVINSAPLLNSHPSAQTTDLLGLPLASVSNPPTATNWAGSQLGPSSLPLSYPQYDCFPEYLKGQVNNGNTSDFRFDTEIAPPSSAVTLSTIMTPQITQFVMETTAVPFSLNESLPSEPQNLSASLIPSPAGPALPFDLVSTFGHLAHVSPFPAQSSRQTSNFQSPLATSRGYLNSQKDSKRKLTQHSGVVEGPELKRQALLPPNQTTKGKENNQFTSTKNTLVGSRLKPGPKSKYTQVQHPPPNPNLMGFTSSEEFGGIPKQILRCMYETINHFTEETTGVVSASKRYMCKIEGCGRIFPRKTAVESHIQTHLEDKPFVCPVKDCNAAFVRQHDLRRHEHVHSGSKPFNCNCGKGFARGDALMRHRQRGICVGSVIPRRF
ncbi:hypothetical protein O181_021882 [Austropuccinia psidii MF-1]|uniref:C2H2-type domain-containing protein n=1 Tax=Austropuccinia psidii MF-1 TaxID=1389203 RepID=A0A9Q3CEF8_9BASI|nr:hypothetical protein [Austropuccinia psidii MF-1]